MTAASSHRGLAFPKGQTRRAAKRADDAHHAAFVGFVRALVFGRSDCCQLCGTPHGRHEMHEARSRAQLRGRPPEVVFNLWNCARLCRDCHADVTAHRVDLVMGRPDKGCNGPLLAQRRMPGQRHLAPPLGDPPAEAVAQILRLWAARPAYRCPCGCEFEEALGERGCPSCLGARRARRI